MRSSIIALASAALLSVGVAHAEPVSYGIDPTHTFSRFSYVHMGLSTQLSRFNKTTGTVTLDKAAKTGAVDVVIDMKSVDTGAAVFNGHIQGEDFLDTAKFPTATFKSTKVVFEGDKPAAVEGNLTIRDVTKKVKMNVTYGGTTKDPWGNTKAGFKTTAAISRKEFGLKWNTMTEAGGAVVGDEVTMILKMEFGKAK